MVIAKDRKIKIKERSRERRCSFMWCAPKRPSQKVTSEQRSEGEGASHGRNGSQVGRISQRASSESGADVTFSRVKGDSAESEGGEGCPLRWGQIPRDVLGSLLFR